MVGTAAGPTLFSAVLWWSRLGQHDYFHASNVIDLAFGSALVWTVGRIEGSRPSVRENDLFS